MPAFKAALDAAEEERVVHFCIEVELEARTRSLGQLKQEWYTHDSRFAHGKRSRGRVPVNSMGCMFMRPYILAIFVKIVITTYCFQEEYTT